MLTETSLSGYVEQARTLGVEVDDPMVAHLLLQAIRYVDARLHARNAGKNYLGEMMERTGQNPEVLRMWAQSPYIPVATQIISEKLIRDVVESDVRKNILDVYAQDSLAWFKNMSRIAKGERQEGSRSLPLERDQIDAYEALTQSEMGQIFTRMMFLDVEDKDVTPEDLHLIRQKQLKGKAVRIEAGIIEGEIRELANPETPAAVLPDHSN